MATRLPVGARSRRTGAVAARAEAVLSWLDSGGWTEEAFFALPETSHLVELVDGRLIVQEMPSLSHQRVSRRLFTRIQAWNEQTRAGEVLYAPYPVRLGPGRVREPDVLVYRAEHASRLGEQYGGPPDFAAEVISASTRHTDLHEKLGDYARGGVDEYWIVDPVGHWIETHTRAGDHYQPGGRFTPGQRVASRVLAGFTLAVADLFDPD